MNCTIEKMEKEHWESVAKIYKEGILTNKATFQNAVPSWTEWDNSHLKEDRLVAIFNNEILGWAALTKVSNRCVYSGVAEVSIYISEKYRGQGIGEKLLNQLIIESEKLGFWTLQSGIIEENVASINLHKKCGFRILATREKVAKMSNGIWHNVVLMERRSTTVGLE